MTDRLDAATRARVTSAGGYGRAAKMTATQRADAAATAGRAGHAPAALARRIAKVWPELTPAQRREVREILAPLIRR